MVIVFAVFGPQAGEGMVIFVENGVAWVYYIKIPQFPLVVKAHTVALVVVFHHRKEIEHGGIGSLFPFHDGRDIQVHGHAVHAGHFV